jgi:hypothetical protein
MIFIVHFLEYAYFSSVCGDIEKMKQLLEKIEVLINTWISMSSYYDVRYKHFKSAAILFFVYSKLICDHHHFSSPSSSSSSSSLSLFYFLFLFLITSL